MKLKTPRFILISGLALAINFHESLPAHAAGTTKRKPAKVAQAPLDLNPAPVPISPTPVQDWQPTPLVPTPAPSAGNVDPVPQPSTVPPVSTVPVPLGTKPSPAPANRPPLGFHYGEEGEYNLRTNPPPKPMSTMPYPGTPTNPLPPTAIAVPLNPVPGNAEDPGDVADANASPALVDRFGYAPPPGTLGQTYKRRSRILEDAKHPRVGVVEVKLPEDVDVSGVGLKTKWTGKVWRLESDPLLPGIPHIYEIKASWGEGTEPHYRTVRLIMGRIVDLEF